MRFVYVIWKREKRPKKNVLQFFVSFFPSLVQLFSGCWFGLLFDKITDILYYNYELCIYWFWFTFCPCNFDMHNFILCYSSGFFFVLFFQAIIHVVYVMRIFNSPCWIISEKFHPIAQQRNSREEKPGIIYHFLVGMKNQEVNIEMEMCTCNCNVMTI